MSISLPVMCLDWRNVGVRGAGDCAAGHKQRPTFGDCLLACDHYRGPSKAPQVERLKVSLRSARLGDVASARIASASGKRPCRGCNKVRAVVNAVDAMVRG